MREVTTDALGEAEQLITQLWNRLHYFYPPAWLGHAWSQNFGLTGGYIRHRQRIQL